MSVLKLATAVSLAASTLTALHGERRCPGNVASLPFRLTNRYQMIVPVSINRSGPYNFLLDTGTQTTIVDTALAKELHLNSRGPAAVEGAGFRVAASLARLDQIEAGSHVLADQEVFVLDLDRLKAANLNVRGVLGEDFLGRFTVLIDNEHSQVCLDATRAAISGEHIPLLDRPNASSGVSESVIVSARLSNAVRPVRLKLDSGTNAAILFNSAQFLNTGILRGASMHGSEADGMRRTFTALPPQNVKIGKVELPDVVFVTSDPATKDGGTSDFDGLLTLGLFRRVFIDHADHFVVLDPW